MSTASTTKVKSHLVAAAEREDRASAVLAGYLRKKNSGGHWQKRWFEIVGHYFVYYKVKINDVLLSVLRVRGETLAESRFCGNALCDGPVQGALEPAAHAHSCVCTVFLWDYRRPSVQSWSLVVILPVGRKVPTL